jgi:predicted nucleic acid-binding protein
VFLFDTNALSEIIKPRGVASVVQGILDTPASQRFASELTRYELRSGAAGSPDEKRMWRRIARDVIPLVHWLDVTESISLAAGDVAADLRRIGRPGGMIDPLIAATALSHGLILVTRNVRHFEPVDELALENWFNNA